tara:strand:+ start:708 stop:1958 length:1251 start_codon:yes stop_codon:yes gene_type:complete
MQQIIIRGGKPLKGKVRISGSKNAALPILAATILTDKKNIIRNVPGLRDIDTFCRLLASLGTKIKKETKKRLSTDSSNINNHEAPYDLVKTMRASFLVMGPLLARFGKAKVSLPGGCAIGARPINLHLKGFELMGAKIKIKDGYVIAKAKRLKGAKIYFDQPTVTGTENLMLAAVLAKGTSLIENAAREPEVVDLAKVLSKMGANIKGAGTDTIEIDGVAHLKGFDHNVIPDRIETGTFMIAAALTKGEIKILNCVPGSVKALILKLQSAGVEIITKDNSLLVKGKRPIKPVDIVTSPHPGFPTDMQAQFMLLMTMAKGASTITETIFENRFMHIAELKRMGADISIEGHMAMVKGVKKLSGAPVMATDLRASACLILAGLAAKGKTTISRVYHLDRGYEKIEEKFSALGASIKRV